MHTRTRLLLSALVAALALSAAVTTAQARRFELSNQFFRVVWSGLTFSEVGGAEGPQVTCAVTLEGSFHSRTLSKVSGQLIGYVTFARVKRPCLGGNAWTLDGVERPVQTLPWHIRYDSFRGTLPNVTGILVQLIDTSFLVEIFPIGCLYKSTTANPTHGIINIEAGGNANTLTADETKPIPLSVDLSGGFCPVTGFLSGTGNVTLQGSTTTRIRVRLVQ
jgi:hypothetical protein